MKKLILFVFLLSGLSFFAPAQSRDSFSGFEQQLIFSGDTAQMMRVFQITEHPDSLILRSKSIEVQPDSSKRLLGLLIRRMFLAMRDTANPGVGIAAPQVGINRRVIWVKRYDKPGQPFEVYLNPKIVSVSEKKVFGTEGCLSVPDVREKVWRAFSITLEYDTPDGRHHKETVSDYTARIFQHEIDHLNGIVFTDYIEH